MSKCLIVPLNCPGKTVHLGNARERNGTKICINDRLSEDHSAYLQQVWLWNGKILQSAKNPIKCLELEGQRTSNGTKVVLWDFDKERNQEWILDGTNIVSSKEPGSCWHIMNGRFGNGTPIHIMDQMNHENGEWRIEYLEKEKESENPEKCTFNEQKEKKSENTENATLNEQSLEDEHCKEWTVDEQPYTKCFREDERKDAVCGPMPCIRACIIL